MHRIALTFLLLSTPAFAQVENVDLARGICANPDMTDEQRAAMVSFSRAEAIRCMGEEWVEAGEAIVQPAARGSLTIQADISINKIFVIDRDGKEHRFLTSPGTKKHPTLEWEGRGPFRLEGPDYVVQDKDKDYVGAPMPWAMFYKDGYAFHGTDQEKKLGRPASHGCLRMFTREAEWLNGQMSVANNSSIKVKVYRSVAEVAPKPKAPRRPRVPRYEEDPYARPVPYDYGYPQPYEPRPYNPWF